MAAELLQSLDGIVVDGESCYGVTAGEYMRRGRQTLDRLIFPLTSPRS